MDQRMIHLILKLWGGDEIATLHAFWFNDWDSSMFVTVVILHLLQKGLLVLGSTRCFVLWIYIHSTVPIPKWSQLPERILEMC